MAIGWSSPTSMALRPRRRLRRLGPPRSQPISGAAGAPERMVQDCAERFGRLDVLVNNAGVIDSGGTQVIDQPPEALRRLLAINLLGMQHASAAAAAIMRGADAGRWRRTRHHRQSRLWCGVAGDPPAQRLQRVQGRGCRRHTQPCLGLGTRWHSGECRRTRLHPHGFSRRTDPPRPGRSRPGGPANSHGPDGHASGDCGHHRLPRVAGGARRGRVAADRRWG